MTHHHTHTPSPTITPITHHHHHTPSPTMTHHHTHHPPSQPSHTVIQASFEPSSSTSEPALGEFPASLDEFGLISPRNYEPAVTRTMPLTVRSPPSELSTHPHPLPLPLKIIWSPEGVVEYGRYLGATQFNANIWPYTRGNEIHTPSHTITTHPLIP